METPAASIQGIVLQQTYHVHVKPAHLTKIHRIAMTEQNSEDGILDGSYHHTCDLKEIIKWANKI